MIGYYCDNNSKCSEIPLENMKIDSNEIGTYNGVFVSRNSSCWGMCDYKIQNQSNFREYDKYTENKPKTLKLMLKIVDKDLVVCTFINVPISFL